MNVYDVVGGTNMIGVDPAKFAMPAGMAVGYDRPADDLTDCFSGYMIYAEQRKGERTDWFLPGLPGILIAVDSGPIKVTIHQQVYDPIPTMSLVGPTSHLAKTVTHGGIMIGIGLTPVGWSRLFQNPAGAYRNRIVPLSDVMPGRTSRALGDAIRQLHDDRHVAPTLDVLLRSMLRAPHADDVAIRQLMTIISSGGNPDIVQVADQMGMPPHRLRRLALRHFGFPPKMLLTRARFLRSLVRFLASGDTADYSMIDPSYFDSSHFLRDANTFLGMTPRRLAAMDTPYLDVSLRARAAVLGAPTHSLQALDAVPA